MREDRHMAMFTKANGVLATEQSFPYAWDTQWDGYRKSPLVEMRTSLKTRLSRCQACIYIPFGVPPTQLHTMFRMTSCNALEKLWKEAVADYLRYYPNIFL